MPHQFDKFGIRFSYPDNWSIEEELGVEQAKGVSVSSPEGAFWSLTIHPAATPAGLLAGAVMEELRREYSDSDVEEISEQLAGREVRGFDVNFLCLDLTNTAKIRTFETGDATYVMIWQAEDRELEQVEPVFLAITTSLIRSANQSGE